nr:uncharacterized protein LOC109158736 [Ipomoea trifida]
MAEERAKEAGGDSKNGDSNDEVFPGVNDSKGKTKVEFPSSSLSSTELRSCDELNERSDESDAKEGPEETTPLSEWEDPMAVELEKLLIPNIKKATLTAMKKIVECGFTEEQAEWAVLNSGISKQKPGWYIRYKVALGTAKGLQYIPRDIKAANILLMEDFEPQNSQSSPMDDTLSTTITTSATHIDIENSYYLHSSDGTGTSLVGTPLVGIDNYTSWALAMTMALRGRNKFCFVDGTLAMPDVSHLDHTRWQRDAATVWSDLKYRFFTANGPRIFELERRIATLRQNETSIAAYHTMLCSLRDELNLLDPPPKCSCSARTAYVTQTESRCLFQFLMGLRETYSQARSQLLLNSVLPTVKGAYALLLQDEKQRTLDHLGTSTDVAALQAATQNSNMSANFQHDFHNLTGTSFTPPMPNNFQTPVIPQQATTQFASQQHPFHMLPNNSHANVATQPRFGNNRSKPRCTHCGILGHTQQVCYKLHGYPPGHKYFKKGNTVGNPPTVPPSPSNSSEPITTETIQQLLRLLREVKEPKANLVGKSHALTSTFDYSNTWVIDTGATDHNANHEADLSPLCSSKTTLDQTTGKGNWFTKQTIKFLLPVILYAYVLYVVVAGKDD